MRDECAALLVKLRRHAVMAEPWLSRPSYDHATWAAMSRRERAEVENASWREDAPFTEIQAACGLITALGELACEEAVPALRTLWTRCVHPLVRQAAGRALFAIATPAAHDALMAMLYDHDELSTHWAVCAIFFLDPRGALKRFAEFLTEEALADPNRRAVAAAALRLYAPARYRVDARGELHPEFVHPDVPRLLRRDRRLLHILLRLRRHPVLGGAARAALSALRHADLEDALWRLPDPLPPRSVYHGPRDFYARYHRGEHRSVWAELAAIGPLPDDLRHEAMAVAREIMLRVRHNAELITSRLRVLSYPFLRRRDALGDPTDDVDVQLRQLHAAIGGPVPLSLRAFWRYVGAIDWRAAAPTGTIWSQGLAPEERDPLVIVPLRDVWQEVLLWLHERDEDHPEIVGPLAIMLAPGCEEKAGFYGDAGYSTTLPSAGAEAILQLPAEGYEIGLVDYLRHAFTWGGFPGADSAAQLLPEVRTLIEALRRDLEPF